MVTDLDTEARLESLLFQAAEAMNGNKYYYNRPSEGQYWTIEWYAPLGHMRVWLRPRKNETGRVRLDVSARIKTNAESPTLGSIFLTDETGQPQINPDGIFDLILQCEPKLLEKKS